MAGHGAVIEIDGPRVARIVGAGTTRPVIGRSAIINFTRRITDGEVYD